jgi:SAM-dependent methyltransferase
MKIHTRDKKHYKLLRNNIEVLLKKLSEKFDIEDNTILDVAPEIYDGASSHFNNTKVFTLDIDPSSGCDYICDLCNNNEDIIPTNSFDLTICTEVLEHTNNPFQAANELIRITKPGGFIAISTPFDFRIHNPFPDNWRFTEHGLKLLFKGQNIISLEGLQNPSQPRNLMPIQYVMVIQKL